MLACHSEFELIAEGRKQPTRAWIGHEQELTYKPDLPPGPLTQLLAACTAILLRSSSAASHCLPSISKGKGPCRLTDFYPHWGGEKQRWHWRWKPPPLLLHIPHAVAARTSMDESLQVQHPTKSLPLKRALKTSYCYRDLHLITSISKCLIWVNTLII